MYKYRHIRAQFPFSVVGLFHVRLAARQQLHLIPEVCDRRPFVFFLMTTATDIYIYVCVTFSHLNIEWYTASSPVYVQYRLGDYGILSLRLGTERSL